MPFSSMKRLGMANVAPEEVVPLSGDEMVAVGE